MAIQFAFDVYGTLINPHAIAAKLATQIGEDAANFSKIWRDKQLEYSFRRAVMGAYEHFGTVTKQALDYACLETGHNLGANFRNELLAAYKQLDAFADTNPALKALSESGAKMHAFSNGHPDDLASLISHAGLSQLLNGVVSVHDVPSFKPDPKVYDHFLTQAGSLPQNTWLVSSNPFDILGAIDCGWKTAWVQRNQSAIFDPWGLQPNVVINTLTDLIDLS